MKLDMLRYPIGHFIKPDIFSREVIAREIDDIQVFPGMMRTETANLSDEQLDTPYRPGGWTVRQVVHHCADSHMNSLTRFKLALTEDKPTIRPYFEDRWAELADSKSASIEPALQMLEGIHARWVTLLNSLSEEDFARVFIHPEHGREMRLYEATALYAWHGKHHMAHITQLKIKNQWN